MLHDLVYSLQNKLVPIHEMYAQIVLHFDLGDYDVPTFFFELSRISAVAKFSNLQDEGITRSFTDRTFELLNLYKLSSTSSFSVTSLLELGYDKAQIQLPGFTSAYDNITCEDNDNIGITNFTNDPIDLALNENLLTSDYMSINSYKKDASNTDNSVDSLDIDLLGNNDPYLGRPAHKMHNNLNLNITEKLEDFESITISKDDVPVMTPSVLEDADEECASHHKNLQHMNPVVELSVLSRITDSPANVINNPDLPVNYKLFHDILYDPFDPNTRYKTSDICVRMSKKHNDRSIFDINTTITHLPLNKTSKMCELLIEFMLAFPLLNTRRISYIPTEPAIFTSFVKLYESQDRKYGLLDCQTVKLYTRSECDTNLMFNFTEQHIDALYHNTISNVMKRYKMKLIFNFTDISAVDAKLDKLKSTIDLSLYYYGKLIVITTYHSYTSKLITAIVYTEYDKIILDHIT